MVEENSYSYDNTGSHCEKVSQLQRSLFIGRDREAEREKFLLDGLSESDYIGAVL